MRIDYYDAILEAKKHGYYQLEVTSTDRGRMVSFGNNGKCGGVRINVYYTTGTVATCLDHPHRGKTQLFRRNMTLEDLKEIFEDPRTHTSKGYHRIPNSRLKYNEDRSMANPSSMYLFQDEDTMDFFKNITKEGIDSISVGCNGFVILYTDGETAWSSGLPKHLHNKLNGRQRWLPRPEIIALGLRSRDSYYVQFADGKAEWCDLPDDLETAIQENDEPVDLIAIGDDDDYYVRFKDGSEDWSLPSDLSNLLNGRNGTRRGNPNLAQVKRISLSDQEEWVVGFSDGQWKWSSNHSSNILDRDVTDEMRSCDKLYELQMGANGNFVFLYEDN